MGCQSCAERAAKLKAAKDAIAAEMLRRIAAVRGARK